MILFALFFFFPFQTEANDLRFIAKFDTQNNGSILRVKSFENRNTNFTVSLSYALNNSTLENRNMTVNCYMDYLKVGVMVNWTDISLPPASYQNSTIQFTIELLAKRLGGSNAICSVRLEPDGMILRTEKVAFFIVSRLQTIHELVFRIVVSILIIFLTFIMGCGLDRMVIFAYIKKPVSPFIGFSCQFLIMPLVSVGLGKLTKISNDFALGLLMVGCSPGGGASNLWTILFSGDLELSMTMTFISSCAALGMMPFWIFVLGRVFMDPDKFKIPYAEIGMNLLQVVIPVGIGMLFRWKWNDKAEMLMKKVKIIGLVFLIFLFTYGSYVNLYIYQLIGDYIYLLPIGAGLPWLGFLFGYLLSLITRRNKTQSIAIALETGFQNIGIAILILKYSMPQPEGDLGSVMPLIVAIFTPFPLYIGYLVLVIKRKCFDKPKPEMEILEMKCSDEEQKEVLVETSEN